MSHSSFLTIFIYCQRHFLSTITIQYSELKQTRFNSFDQQHRLRYYVKPFSVKWKTTDIPNFSLSSLSVSPTEDNNANELFIDNDLVKRSRTQI